MASTYYDTLQVDNKATYAQIQKAYRRLVLKLHPDKNNNSAKYEQLTKQLNEAYAILSNPESRKIYDHKLFSSHYSQKTQTTYAASAQEEVFSFSSFFNDNRWLIIIFLLTLSRISSCNKSNNNQSSATDFPLQNNSRSVGDEFWGSKDNK